MLRWILPRGGRRPALNGSVFAPRFRAYCIGSAKSGTHSIAALFARSYASRHEPEHSPMIRAILDRSAGKLGVRRARRFLLRRSARLGLEMDSSQLNGHFVDLLPGLFPDARFILTLRDCYSFLRSAIDHQLARGGGSKTWDLMREHRFGGFTHSRHERALAERGLYPIDGYLSYWARHNQEALDCVPSGRLLVIRTNRIEQSIPQIASFLGIPADSLDADRSHSYPAANRFRMLRTVNRGYLEDRVQAICGPLMRRFYSELTRADAVLDTLAAMTH